MSFLDLAQKRYSCRKFSPKVVEDDKINKIIESALASPTAVNRQPFKIWVIKDSQAIEKIAKATPFTFGASTIFVIGANSDESYVRNFDGKNFAQIDATIVATHMMLEIQDSGLGTTWVGHFDPKILADEFPQMKGYEIVAIFPTGYPSPDADPSEMHYKSKSAQDVVSVL